MTAKELMKWTKKNKACEKGLAFAKGKTLAEVWATCERPDWMMWLYGRSKNPEKIIYVMIAIFIVELNLPDFEKKYPKDDRPRKALEAAKAWVESPTEENRQACKIAANNAYNCDTSADCAAYCAYSDYAYAPYVDYSATYLKVKQQKKVVNFIRKLIPSIELK